MIPGFLITWVTFPGVIVHELAHALFCRLFGIGIYQVVYFQFATHRGQPSGYVVHQPAKHAWQDVIVGIGPFFINSILGAVIAGPATIPVFQFHSGDVLDYFLIWLGVSIAMHAFPSTGDAKSIWQTVTSPGTPTWTKIIGEPIVGLIYLGALASMFWADVLYGIAIAGFLPGLIVKMLA